MVGRYLIVLATTGCAGFAGIGDPAPLAADAPDAPELPCTIGGLDLCLYSRPTSDLIFTDDLEIDTDTDCTIEIYAPPGPSLCVHYARNIEVNAIVHATGSRPLVLAASEELAVTGTVDVSSHRDSSKDGAAANDAECVHNTSFNTGPGAGGSFAGEGGDAGGQSGVDPTAVHKGAAAVTLPDRLRGGCSSDFATGKGGGAVWLAAGATVTLQTGGFILANGGGGKASSGLIGTTADGGGSGGFVKIGAPAIVIAGIVAANGGGGAEGRDNNTSGSVGSPGSDGLPGAQQAPGGNGGSPTGGDGGSGGAGSLANGGNGNTTSTAGVTSGGGGGGVGFIQLIGDVNAAGGTISPPPVLVTP